MIEYPFVFDARRAALHALQRQRVRRDRHRLGGAILSREPSRCIPFNVPYVTAHEFGYVARGDR